MDSGELPLEDLMDNFDPGSFLTAENDNSILLKQGMKSLNEDLMPTGSFAEDSLCVSSEAGSDNSSIHQHTMPCTTEIAGNHNFQIQLGTQPKRVANPDWVYKNDKLYIKPATLCPIILSASPSVPRSCSIMITPVFKNPADMRDIVRCCPNHTVMDGNKNGFSSVAHFIRCDNEKVMYKECPLTGRYYLVLPFVPSQQDPTAKTVKSHELFSFICNNSCGGLNRRPIQVIFEMIQGQAILGRRLLEVRVCACPGRDSKLEETQKQPLRRRKRHQTIEEPLYLHVEDPPYQPPPVIKVPDDVEMPPRKKKASGENFYLKINGRQNFMIMERIAKALELFTSMEKRFFSKHLPFQAQESMSRLTQNEGPEYVEPDSTLYRRTPNRENQLFNNHHSPPLSPNSIPSQWTDNTHQHCHSHQSPTSSQSIPRSYQSHTVRRASLVN